MSRLVGRWSLGGFFAFAFAILLLVGPAPALAASPQQDVQRLDRDVGEAQEALADGDVGTARQEYQAFEAGWPSIEDGVRAADRNQYRAIEAAMRDVRRSLLADPVDSAVAGAALARLHETNAAFIQTNPGSSAEDDMAQAQNLLRSQPVRESDADAVLTRMRDRLAPLVEVSGNYSVFDAFVIMLREGLEALLVIGALTAFLRRSGNADKQSWIWGGAGLGVALSVALAVVLQQVFQRAGAGLGSELVEGSVGLIAAAMLFYVSYWLHSKARLGAWQTYIRQKSSAAVAGGSMLSLGLVALLAVFREGAETAVFYLGIAPSISPSDLLLGLGLGVLALALIGAALLVIGLRLPLRPFFLASSALIYYLGFKFVGTGLHALQVAGVLPATPGPLPSSDALGVYPTWETAVPQLMLLALAAAVLWLTTRQPASREPASVSSAV
jgi:high-affinity iron transporter